MRKKEFSHTDEQGKINMVDVGNKKDQLRIAEASGFIFLNIATISLIKKNLVKKGDVITTAKIAGIQAVKKTYHLIPLCHSLALTKIKIEAEIKSKGVQIKSFVSCIGKTGVEMEALTGVSIALLTIYDMCKAVDKEMTISEIKLLKKTKQDILSNN